ncbi:hypothetical protein [Brumimicrobium mesophilum]|uniref:hypothetical protein n=1 Tax=Brumimicrobium mesophilum TaxID=392717 RepID=UPI000D143F4C|nr:hypothetical protein [Brumimicrobium mesophilum]
MNDMINIIFALSCSLFFNLTYSQDSDEGCVKDSTNVYRLVEKDAELIGNSFQIFVRSVITTDTKQELIKDLTINMLITKEGKAKMLSIDGKSDVLNLMEYQSSLWTEIELNTKWIPALCHGTYVDSYKSVHIYISYR